MRSTSRSGRKTSLWIALLVSFAAVDAPVAQNPAATRVRALRGQVIDARAGVPLRRAQVTIAASERPQDVVFTDDEGRFVIPDAPAGGLTVRASKAGYARASAVVPPARTDADVRIALARSAAIQGRVVDRNGTPHLLAYVTARLLLPDGSAMPDGSGRFFTRTNRLGEYRLGELPGGRYRITAARPPLGSFDLEARLFGPPEGLVLADRSVTMVLRPGDEARDVDFALRAEDARCTRPQRPAGDNDQTGVIAGRIVDPSGQPIACATVSVLAVSTSESREARTNADGRYAFERLGAGSFVLRAAQAGFVALEHGQRAPSDLPAPIVLDAGERRTRVDVALPRVAVISGTVTDEHGEPVAGIPVIGFQIRRVQGRLERGATVAGEQTDDRGRYRLIGAQPGTYIVAARARGALGTIDRARGYTTMYHPGTLSAALARAVTVDVGEDLAGISISLAPTATALVSGSAFDGMGRPFAGRLSMSLSTRSGGPALETWGISPGVDGSFVFRQVPPGEYVVTAIGQDPNRPEFGVRHVTVGDTNPPPIQIVASGGATLEGRITIDGSSCQAIAGLVAVSTVSADADYSDVARRSAPAFRKSDGTFTLVGLAGPTRLTLDERPGYESCFLQSARIEGADAADRPFDFGTKGGVYRDVEIVVSDRSASLEGRVVLDPDVFVSRFWAIVMPVFEDLRFPGSRHLKIAEGRRDGTFRIDGLPPGDYLVGAVHHLDSFTAGSRQVDDDLLEELAASPLAERVSLAEREREGIDLRLIR